MHYLFRNTRNFEHDYKRHLEIYFEFYEEKYFTFFLKNIKKTYAENMSSNQNRQFFTSIINMDRLLGTQHSRSVNQRRRRRVNRLGLNTYQIRNVLTNNRDTLDRIVNLSTQTSSDLLINQFYNGSSFI
ncbi:7485_t:CDS:2 [Funneliformis caledonium]|uniref:7485_t:CDS:1 n=1 Tax=Funneliformis caledonium TaxID=1117310 RepID=A0A9N8VAT8_9GLOM|nr:7485_t:CDS:2 [Funneliformis caledonium]